MREYTFWEMNALGEEIEVRKWVSPYDFLARMILEERVQAFGKRVIGSPNRSPIQTRISSTTITHHR